MRFFYPQNDRIRLRVIANSDAPEDQKMKLRVRDAVLPEAMQCPTRLHRLRKIARTIDASAKVSRGVFHFGGYASDTILVTLGAGKGRNWWGILFPAMVGLPDEPAQFESLILNLLRSWGLL